MQWFKTNRETSGFKYFKGDEAMSKMRKTGGYMTVEVSALIPIVLMVLWLFFGYLFYLLWNYTGNYGRSIAEGSGYKNYRG